MEILENFAWMIGMIIMKARQVMIALGRVPLAIPERFYVGVTDTTAPRTAVLLAVPIAVSSLLSMVLVFA